MAQAELSATSIDGDPVVFDVTNGEYWYPLMSDMIQLTRDQQVESIQQLNGANFARRSNWRFATIAEVIALVESMMEGADQSL